MSNLTYLQRKTLDFFFSEYSDDVWKTLVTFENPYILGCDVLCEQFEYEPVENIKEMVKALYGDFKEVDARGCIRGLQESLVDGSNEEVS